MRHEQIARKDTYNRVDVAAVWPVGAQVAPPPVPDSEEVGPTQQATPAAPDVPPSVGKMIVGAYAVLLATFALATVGSAYSLFMIVIAAMFMVAFFSVPWLFLKQERRGGARLAGLGRFMEDGIQTLTGHSSGGAALVQMMIVPVFLTLAVAVMGIAAAIIL